MKKRFYRIRNLDSLLDKYKELENQEIFFQSTDKLNDPMEGFMDFIFKGDEVVWKNLIIHFIFCFSKVNLIYQVIGEKIKLDNKIIPIFEKIDLQKKQYYFDLLGDSNKNKFYEFINKDSISRSELESFLKDINLSFIGDISFLESKIFENDNLQNLQFLLNFYSHYLEVIEQFTYPKYYIASFLKESYNSSVWGHYGQGHSGVCLIFETNNEGEIPFLNVYTGLKLKEVNYNGNFEEINFFESLGKIPQPLVESFYIDENKNKSILFDKVLNNQEEWRKLFWDKYEKNKLTKTKDWTYEKEYRIVLNRLMDYEIKEEDRKLKYDFNCLKGVIFGIKTPQNKKDEIIEIIINKCHENNILDFEFYQAFYCKESKNIQHKKLDVNIINDLIKKAKQNKLDLNIEFLTLNKRKEEIDNENGEVEKRISKLEEINNIKNT
ncbi:DUF2971 domain-containing protein [Aliarcobacter butzleri]|uniref:DUF2971 domain-containing protein n=1 Tax=Aliarcobacter butzleri (strain RM4018) TaxID=367737 RepID=A8ET87_ALIB4|nr:DUF2971 domain-containing protein [Aliarcobacter butzleri]ABV67161.1 hypothetical protein Abu_0901 [Aliarcobacter butzleri RM4018]MCG3662396.1 DUF2971 domain-containing protein [Aliarcobacter butzleri]MDN5104496.1 DUF2971 domain-containing protein [Aliarcobacter butzleri]SNV27045.1 Protein of uncharacterised function (DUF2971) [Aliarcobacter butzleri]